MATKETNSLWAHLNELRKRLIICLAAVAAGIILSLIFADKLFQFLIWPTPGIKLIFIDVTEMLGTYMQVCLVSGIIVAMPVLVYQLIAFVTPALTQHEKRYVWIILPFIVIMFAGGVAFSYFVLLPPAMQFLITFGTDIATPQIRIGNYVSLVGRLLLATGIIFETPVITTFLARIGVISSRWLAQQRKWAIVAAFILGAIITPTLDPVNQTLIALPLIVLYEISIWLAKLVEKRHIRNPGLTSS
ncbi:MAG: twin-arginine translocase subunit TatC [Dehalococcoidia bacterium]|nr:MAG: twin-arginine translocase subunit TatC [Dehalococcoidia bacterium]